MPPKIEVPTNSTAPIPLVPAPIADTADTFAGLRIVKASDMVQDAWCMLLYANPGVGKTTMAGMFSEYPGARDVLMVDVEGGATAVSDREHIDVVQAQKWQDIANIVTTLERTPLDKLRYRTVVFDNLSEMQMMNLKTITTGEVQIQHWGRNTTNMMEFTRRVRDLARFKGINVVLIAWRSDNVNVNSKRYKDGVSLTNKLAEKLPGVVNVVGYLSILDNPPTYTRRLSFAASPRSDAKFRRARGDAASALPLELYYGATDNPIVDILRTLYEGVPFPVKRYERPRGRQSQASSGSDEVSSDDTVSQSPTVG